MRASDELGAVLRTAEALAAGELSRHVTLAHLAQALMRSAQGAPPEPGARQSPGWSPAATGAAGRAVQHAIIEGAQVAERRHRPTPLLPCSKDAVRRPVVTVAQGLDLGAEPRRLRLAEPLRADVQAKRLPPLPVTAGGWSTVLADPPWRFVNRTGKVAPEHRRLDRYDTMTAKDIAGLPVAEVAADHAHLYLWVPNALLPEGLQVMEGWGFRYVSNLVWAKRRKDGGPDGRGVGFYFRNVTELVLFGVRGSMRTLPPGRRQVNMIETRKREHSRKPDEAYDLIEACSPGPYLELFARYPRSGWTAWGDEAEPGVRPRGRQWPAYGRDPAH